MKKVLVFLTFTVVLLLCLSSCNSTCNHDDPDKIVVLELEPPTCQRTGLTSGMKCILCDTMVVPQATVDIIECIESSWIIDKNPTKNQEGKKHTECTMCGKLIKNRIIPAGSQGLKYLLIGDGTYVVSSIGNCKDTELVIPKSYNDYPISKVYWMAFYQCNSLESVIIPDPVIEIDSAAFASCTSLASVTIPNSVQSIGFQAFYDCSVLSSIHFTGSVAQWNSIKKDDQWDFNTGNYTIYCTDGKIAKDGTVTYN